MDAVLDGVVSEAAQLLSDAVDPVAPNHSNRMMPVEDAMAAGIAVHAGVALSWLDRGLA